MNHFINPTTQVLSERRKQTNIDLLTGPHKSNSGINGGSLWIAPPRKFRLALHFAFAFRAKSDRRVAETRSASPGFKRRVKGPNRAVKGPTTVRPVSNDRTSDRPTAIHFWGGYPYRPAITIDTIDKFQVRHVR